MSCIKKSTGMSAKKDVKCSQIFSMFFLFVLASFSATIGLLASISIRFIYEEKRDASLTPQEKSIIVYKDELNYELITRLIGLFTSILFGYMYEVWERKKVLSLLIILLCIGLVFPALEVTENKSTSMIWARVITGVVANAIMANPLLMDYVKKHNRGVAAAM